MRLFMTHRQAAQRHWKYFGRPYLTVIGAAALVGFLVGLLWVIAGLLRFRPFW